MSDTHVNAFKLELSEKEAQLATVKGEVEALKRKVSAMEAETAEPDSVEALELPVDKPSEPTKVEVKDESDEVKK